MPSRKTSNLRGLFGYAEKIICLQTGSADQSAINVGLSHEFGDISSRDAATIENTDIIGNVTAMFMIDYLTDKADGLVGLFPGS